MLISRALTVLLYVNDLCNVSTRLAYILFADDLSRFIEGTDLSDTCIQLSTYKLLTLVPGLRQKGYISVYQKQLA